MSQSRAERDVYEGAAQSQATGHTGAAEGANKVHAIQKKKSGKY